METFEDWQAQDHPRYERCDTLADVFAVWHRTTRPDADQERALQQYSALTPEVYRKGEATPQRTYVMVSTLDEIHNALESVKGRVTTNDLLAVLLSSNE